MPCSPSPLAPPQAPLMFLQLSQPKVLPLQPLLPWKANEKPPAEVESLLTSAVTASRDDNGARFRQIMQDLLHFYLSEELHLGKCLALMKTVDFRDQPQLAEGVADLYWLIGSQVS